MQRPIVAQLSKLRVPGSQVGNLRPFPGGPPVTVSAFTIMELVIVIAIIIALAGLILGTFGYVQKKGARSRAESEIAALIAALENYKADNGSYPRGNGAPGNLAEPFDTDQLFPNVDPDGGNPIMATFTNSSRYLYRQLSGDSDGDPTISNTAADTKNYLGTALRPNMLNPKPPGANTYMADPFGNAYGYSTAYAADVINNPGNPNHPGYNPTFDLWSTCGETAKKTNESFQEYQQRWIKNW